MRTEKNSIETLFNRLQSEFDTETPEAGHKERFLEKLATTQTRRKTRQWKTLSIAASIALLVCVGVGVSYKGLETRSANDFPEVENAQFYFTSVLQQEIEKVNAMKTPDTRQIIADAMSQLAKLEEDYTLLQKDLLQNGNSKAILNAMVTNFQTRIDLLQEVLLQIDEINNFKMQKDETKII